MKYLYPILFSILFTGVTYAQDVAKKTIRNDYDVKLFPNPALDDEIYIKTDANGMKKVKIFDVFGEAIVSKQLENNPLDISELAPGVYLIQVRQKRKSGYAQVGSKVTTIGRLLIQHGIA